MSIEKIFYRLSGWYRLLVVASVVWVVFFLINWDKFLTFGVLPVIIIWGVIWIVQGFRQKKE